METKTYCYVLAFEYKDTPGLGFRHVFLMATSAEEAYDIGHTVTEGQFREAGVLDKVQRVNDYVFIVPQVS